MPTDALRGPVPTELETLASGSASVASMRRAWRTFKARDVPPRLERAMDDALARQSDFDVNQTALDLQLRHLPPTEIDRKRFDLWARRLIVDAKAGNAIGVTGDLVVLEWIRDRIAQTLDAVDRTRINTRLVTLRANVSDEDLPAAAAEATRLRNTSFSPAPVG